MSSALWDEMGGEELGGEEFYLSGPMPKISILFYHLRHLRLLLLSNFFKPLH